MKFLNKKEEVLDIQLTQYGKYLFSQGKFKPEYYAFFDTDVLYDDAYVGLTESQNNIHDRIKEIPQFEAQYLYHGVETEISKINKLIKMGEANIGENKIQQTPEKHYSLTAPIGTISLDSFSAPAWSLKFLKGEIEDSTSVKEGDHQTLKIPQLDLKDIEYKTITKQYDISVFNESLRTNLGILTDPFKDGSYIDVYENYVLIDVEEINSIFSNDNFEVEVFQISEETVSSNVRENLIPLAFTINKKELIKNGILLDEVSVADENIELNSSHVEYFFEILFDEDIFELETITKDIYSSVTREEDIRKC